MRHELFSALTKLSTAFQPIAKLEAEVKKNCHTCSADAYKPVPQGDSKLAQDLGFQAAPRPTDVTDTEAQDALSRLKRLEETKPSAGELARGAAVGATVSPIATLAARGIGGEYAFGDLTKKLTDAAEKSPKGLTNRLALKSPLAAKALLGTRSMGAAATMGAFFGGAMPAVRSELERGAERKKLRTYLGQQQQAEPGYLRQLITNTTG